MAYVYNGHALRAQHSIKAHINSPSPFMERGPGGEVII